MTALPSTDFCRVAALLAAEKHGLQYDAFVQAMKETLAVDVPAATPDWHTALRELLEVVEARNSQGGAFKANPEGQRRIDAAKALLATAPPSPYAPITECMANRMRSLGDWLRNSVASTAKTDRGASEIYGAWAGAIDDLLQPACKE